MKCLNCSKLSEHYKSILKNFPPSNDSLRELFKKEFNDGLEVVVEYDENRPCFGIYYGIRTKKGVEFEQGIEGKIKNFFLENFWYNTHPASVKHYGQRIFLEDDLGNSVNGTYWPLWIRLEDGYPVTYAIEGAEILIDALKNCGYTTK